MRALARFVQNEGDAGAIKRRPVDVHSYPFNEHENVGGAARRL